MASKKQLRVETPGAPQEPERDTPQSVARKEATLKQQIAATASLVGSPDAIDWSGLTQADAAKGLLPVDEENKLPDQSAVDAETITEPVLTRQGWVVPVHDVRARAAGR